ncbi:hypothetical protein [Marinobacterium rhizophilum]|nr:hypothetical protein [Marinobacterium rhizophilum]
MLSNAWTLDWFLVLNAALLTLTAGSYAWRELKAHPSAAVKQ